MANEGDMSQAESEVHLRAALASRDTTPGPEYVGYCLNCREYVDPPRRWCDRECRDMWERDNG